VTAGHRVVVSATPAIGAEAVVYLDQDRKLVAQVDGGNGHSGVRSPDLHFGLGAVPSEKKLRVRLRWRDLSGRSHEQDVSLTPGWHTVVLAAPATGDQPVATR
jgi:hypothetical protein